MKPFWFFLPFFAALIAINAIYLPGAWFLATLIVLTLLGLIILVNNLRLARSNLEIKVERNELGSIISNLYDGVIAYDSNFKILIFNKAAGQIFNIPESQVIGQSFSPERGNESGFKLLVQVIFPSLAPVVIRRSETGDYPQVVDLSMENPRAELRVTTDKIMDPAGRLLGFVKLVHDRTRELDLLRSKTEFIGVASHQLRTPLTGVNWALESLAKNQENLDDGQKELIGTALQATAKLLKTINDLLDVSKMEEGRFGYDFQDVEIISFVDGIVQESQMLAKEYGIKVYFQRPEEPSIAISIDQIKLSMVFANLIDNAVKYNVENGEVVIGLERVPGEPYVRISVKDTGVGIPADQMDKLFTKFFRAENVVRKYTEGSGLGLYIAKNIIKRHGGQIWAESEISRGTTFYFTLPTDKSLIPPKELVYGEE
jgi:two-component system sensor histidine kinase VicK